MLTGVDVATGRIEGVRLLEGEALSAALVAIAKGDVKPAPIATPLPAPLIGCLGG